MTDLEKLESILRPVFNKIENELNKNTVKINFVEDLQPGNIYLKPTIVSVDTHTDGNYRAGFIKSLYVKEEFLKSNKKVLKRAVGYAFCSEVINYPEQVTNFKYLLEEIKLALKQISNASCEELNWGEHYIKFGPVVEEEESACFGFEISTNVLPVVELGADNNKYL